MITEITAHGFIATSLDGYIARKDGDLDFLPQKSADGEDFGYKAFIGGIDGIIMGRKTFEKVLTFGDWPYKKPVTVLSQSLPQKALLKELKGKAQVSQGSPKEVMDVLQKEGMKRVYVDGGQVIQSFLKEGLVQDIVITVVPVLLGEGACLFGKTGGDIHLQLLASKAFFRSGMVQNHYQILYPRGSLHNSISGKAPYSSGRMRGK